MRTPLHLLLYLACLPCDLVLWVANLLMWAMWGENLRLETPSDDLARPRAKDKGEPPGGPVLSFDLKRDSFPVTPGTWPKGFYLMKMDKQRPSHRVSWGATTLGHAIFYGPDRRLDKEDPWQPVQVHEHVHVEQYEASMLRAFLVGLAVVIAGQSTASLWVGGLIWLTGYLQMGVANWTTAILRGEDPYRGSVHEEAAYAIDELYEQQMEKRS